MAEMLWELWEPSLEKLPFLFTRTWCTVEGRLLRKWWLRPEQESPWMPCCWALWSGPSTVQGALRA